MRFFPCCVYMEGGSGLASGMLTKECCDGDLCCDIVTLDVMVPVLWW